MKPALPIAGPWPRLSDDLPLSDPRECAQCGSVKELSVWQEHDTADNPKCAAAIIDPHPLFYHRLQPNEPAPGVMPICQNCAHRAGSKCWHPQGLLRGGPGVRLVFPAPTTAHLYYGGRKGGEWIKVYPGVVYDCAGKELDPAFTAV